MKRMFITISLMILSSVGFAQATTSANDEVKQAKEAAQKAEESAKKAEELAEEANKKAGNAEKTAKTVENKLENKVDKNQLETRLQKKADITAEINAEDALELAGENAQDIEKLEEHISDNLVDIVVNEEAIAKNTKFIHTLAINTAEELSKHDKKISALENEMYKASALSASLAGLKALPYDADKPIQLLASYGYYKKKSSLALGINGYINESILVNLGLAVPLNSFDDVMFNVGVGIKLGKKSTKTTKEEIKELKEDKNRLIDEVNNLKKELSEIKNMLVR